MRIDLHPLLRRTMPDLPRTSGIRNEGGRGTTEGDRIGSNRSALLDPGHHLAELGADLLDLHIGLLLAHPIEVGRSFGVLFDPLAREPPGGDLLQDLLHLLARALGDDALAARVVAVLSGVADRVAHELET